MSDKSFVGLESHICLVCAKPFETGSLLLDMSLKETLKSTEVTGYGFCPEHSDSEYIHLVVLRKVPNRPEGESVAWKDADRTGMIISIKKDIIREIIPALTETDLPMAYIDEDVVEALGLLEHSIEEEAIE